jgi:hypothetical protein
MLWKDQVLEHLLILIIKIIALAKLKQTIVIKQLNLHQLSKRILNMQVKHFRLYQILQCLINKMLE